MTNDNSNSRQDCRIDRIPGGRIAITPRDVSSILPILAILSLLFAVVVYRCRLLLLPAQRTSCVSDLPELIAASLATIISRKIPRWRSG